MKITLIVQQTFDIEANTVPQAYHLLHEGYFPTSELLLAVKDESGHDITEQWQRVPAEMQD